MLRELLHFQASIYNTTFVIKTQQKIMEDQSKKDSNLYKVKKGLKTRHTRINK